MPGLSSFLFFCFLPFASGTEQAQATGGMLTRGFGHFGDGERGWTVDVFCGGGFRLEIGYGLKLGARE
jgi:hypothetical protein